MDDFVPRRGWSNPHLQTVRSRIRPIKVQLPPSDEVVVTLPDGSGDRLAVQVHEADPSQPLVIIVHGLGGTAESDYVRFTTAGLLAADEELAVRAERAAAVARLATEVGADAADPRGMLRAVLTWLGGSSSPLVTVWLEDLWLEEGSINLPGTAADLRPNWQRPLAAPLEDLLADPEVVTLAEVLAVARRGRP